MFEELDLAMFGVSAERGCLPTPDPLHRLSKPFEAWEHAGKKLPQLLAARQWGETIYKIPPLNARLLHEREYERAHMLLSYFTSALVWEFWQIGVAVGSIPANIAVPYAQISEWLDRPPILSYVSYALNNWRRIDPHGPIELENIILLQHFLGGLDEEWFTLVHVEIEMYGGQAIHSAVRAQEAAMRNDAPALLSHLNRLAVALDLMYATFCEMPDRCDPYIYYHRVRPWIHGWNGGEHSPLPHGVVYEGVERFGGKPQKFRGETGAQSSIAPILDAVLGIKHSPNELSEHLSEMPLYMPLGHRNLIACVRHRPSVRKCAADNPHLVRCFNACIDLVADFRNKHLEYAASFINLQAHIEDKVNPKDVGTGGTPYMASLKKHVYDTLSAKI